MYDPHDATVMMCERKYSKYYEEDLDAATKQRYDDMLPESVDDPYINSLFNPAGNGLGITLPGSVIFRDVAKALYISCIHISIYVGDTRCTFSFHS